MTLELQSKLVQLPQEWEENSLETLKFILNNQNSEKNVTNIEDVESLGDLDNKWVTSNVFSDIGGLLEENWLIEHFSIFMNRISEWNPWSVSIDNRHVYERKEWTKDICYKVVDDKVIFGHFNEDWSPVWEIIIVNDENIRYWTVGDQLVFENNLDNFETKYWWYISDEQNIENVLNYSVNKIEDEDDSLK